MGILPFDFDREGGLRDFELFGDWDMLVFNSPLKKALCDRAFTGNDPKHSATLGVLSGHLSSEYEGDHLSDSERHANLGAITAR